MDFKVCGESEVTGCIGTVLFVLICSLVEENIQRAATPPQPEYDGNMVEMIQSFVLKEC